MKLLAYLPGTRDWRKRRDHEICVKAYERVQEIVDGELPATKAARVLEHHLEQCPPCHQEAEMVRSLKQAIHRVSCEADAETVQRLEKLARQLCDRTDETS